MSKASTTAMFIRSHTMHTFNDESMCSMIAGDYADFFDAYWETHKYFDSDAATEHLGLPSGAGVYGRVVFKDGSWIGLTCPGFIAVCDEKGFRRVE